MKKIYSIACASLLAIFSLAAHAQMNPKIKLQDALKLIQDNYVDPVNDERVVDAAIKGMLNDLDPHSSYVGRAQIEAMNDSRMAGSFTGIGIQFEMTNDSTFITGLNFDGPAARAGLKLGDRILEIDGQPIFGKSLKNQQIMMMIRGEKGKAVILKVMRNHDSNPIILNIVREQIAEYSINTYYMVDKNIGYISLAIFSQSTRREIDAAIKDLKAQGMKKLILDLQSNGGGYVEAAIGVADEFLPKEKLVFYSVTNTGVKDNYLSGGFGQFYEGELVVLIDESTASSSEIVTGALQDWDRAVVIGRRSFGKGLMQKSLELSDGSVIHLTAARYYTPSGRSIQKPYVKGMSDYYEDFNRRLASGELTEEGHFKFSDSLKYITLTNKRTVYGGGGIMPDKFVPIDTTLYSKWMGRIMNSGLVNRIALAWVHKHRDSVLLQYRTFIDFDNNFSPNDGLLNQVFDQAITNKIAMPAKTDIPTRNALRTELKAEIAGMLYTGKGLQLRVRNEANKSYQEAIVVLQNPSAFSQLLGNSKKRKSIK